MISSDSPRRRRLRLICPAFPAFNIYSRPASHMTAMGPVCIATAVHDVPGWDVEVIDENNYRGGPLAADGLADHAALQRERPADAVGLYGGLTSTVPRLYEIARQYREMGVTTLAGGQHFVDENLVEAFDNGLDLVVCGEGEQTIQELLPALDAGEPLDGIDGLAYRRDGQIVRTSQRAPMTDFDALPIPDYSVLRYAKLKYFSISGVRGCGMDCEFCTVKGKPRFASADRMMRQFASAHQQWGARVFFIVDDLFGQNRAETLELCRRLHDYQQANGVKFSITVQIRLDRARDGELLKAMWSAGVRMLAVGFESPIAEELDAMSKRLDPDQMIELTHLYRKAGFRVHGMFIFGYPMKDGSEFHMPAEERAARYRRFIKAAGLDTVQILLPGPLPGTELTQRLAKQGRIYPTDLVGWEYYDGNFVLFEPDPPLTAESMQKAVRGLMRWFYGPRHLLALTVNVLSFPAVACWLSSLPDGWRRWTRRWGTVIFRVGGWLTLRKWTAHFRRGNYRSRLRQAQQRVRPLMQNTKSAAS